MESLAVYNQMTSSPSDLFNVLRREIGIKSNCLPFAVKAIDALNSLGNMTEAEATKAAHVFLDNMQTLTQGGITAEDYDKLDMVKRGKAITVSARVEAFLRAAARKGYRITETIVAVPKEDGDSTYFKENFFNGEIVYTLEDKRIQGDRKITAERLISNYFSKFIIRLEVTDIKQSRRIIMTSCEMSNEEILSAAAASDSGIYKTKWESYTDYYGKSRKRKVISEELNTGSIWNVWTSEMVVKTVIRRALKRVREVLPELKDSIYAFDHDPVPQELPQESVEIEIPMEVEDVDLNNLTEKQGEEVKEMCDLFVANPKMAADKAKEIMAEFDGKNAQQLINKHYASIVNLKRSKGLRPVIAPLFKDNTPRGEADE